MVLISARPFRVGERVRLQAGGLAGQIEGVVASLGLLYTTFAAGEDSIMVPNNVVLSAAVVPLREPAAVDLRARLRPDVKPSDVQALLEERSRRRAGEPQIALEEVDRDEVVVRIAGDAGLDADGPRLADEVLAAIAAVTRGERDGGEQRRRGVERRPPEATAPRPSRGVRALSVAPGRRRRAAAICARAARGAAGPRAPAPARARRAPRRARSGSGATSISARSRSIAAHDRARRRPRASACRRRRQLGARRRANMPASRMKPGKITETPTPMRPQVLAQAEREAAQAELRRRVDRRAAASPALPDSEDMKTMWPRAARDHPLGSSRASSIGARRLTSSARSICSTRERRRAAPLAGSAGVGDEHVDLAGLGQRAAPGAARSARSARERAAAELGRERLEHLGAAAGERRAARRGRRARARSRGRGRRSRR